MTLNRLQKDMISAMKEGDKPRKEVLSSMIGAIKKAAIDKKCRDNIPEFLTDEVLIREQKMAQEMIDTCPADRNDLLEKYNYNISVIKEYAPQLEKDPTKIKEMILDITNGESINKKNRGIIMKTLKGKVDMAIANKVIQEMM